MARKLWRVVRLTFMDDILLLYATYTGNTQEGATSLQQKLSGEFPQKKFLLSDVKEIDPADMQKYKLVIFGHSTLDSLMTPDTDFFISDLKSARVSLTGTTWALYCFGDSAYQVFCGAQELVRKELLAMGAKIHPGLLQLDGPPQKENLEKLLAWSKTILGK